METAKIMYDDNIAVLMMKLDSKQKKDTAAFMNGLVKGIEIGQVLAPATGK